MNVKSEASGTTGRGSVWGGGLRVIFPTPFGCNMEMLWGAQSEAQGSLGMGQEPRAPLDQAGAKQAEVKLRHGGAPGRPVHELEGLKGSQPAQSREKQGAVGGRLQSQEARWSKHQGCEETGAGLCLMVSPMTQSFEVENTHSIKRKLTTAFM